MDQTKIKLKQMGADEKRFLFQSAVEMKQMQMELEEEKRDIDKRMRQLTLEEKRLKREQELFDMKLKVLEQELRKLSEEKKKVAEEKAYYDQQSHQENYLRESEIEVDIQQMFFRGVDNEATLKKRYRDLLKIFHPDNVAGDTNTIVEINREYAQLKKQLLYVGK